MENLIFYRYYKIYLIIIFILTTFYLLSLNSVHSYNAMSEWVINYQGGFVRRGFIGEIFYIISKYINVNLKFSFSIVQIVLYGLLFFYFYKLLLKLEYSKLVLFVIFSPVFLFFPLAELEAIGRKEILVNLLMISLFLLKIDEYKKLFFFFVASLIVLLTHEIIVFYFLNFLFFFILIKKKNNSKYNLICAGYFILLFLATILLSINEYTQTDKEEMCNALLNDFNIVCGFQAHYVVNNVSTYVNEVSWNLEHYLRNLFIYIIGFGPLLIFSYFTKYNEEKCKNIVTKIPLFLVLFILSIFNLIIFLISVDTGRYFHLSYSNLVILIFGLNYLNLIVIDYEKINNFEIIIFKDSKILFIFFFTVICFTWTPKAVFKEDLGSIPHYRTLQKIPNFTDNFNNLKFINKK